MTPATRTVAILSPDFPPSSMPSSIRARLFAAHLPEFGWRPVVIAASPEHYSTPVDADNEKLLPEGLEVVRTGAWPARYLRRLGVGDIGIRSLRHQWLALRKLRRSRRIDLIFVTVPPYVPMILGRLAFHRFGVPYVIDYQDPWVTEVYWHLPRAERPPKWPLAYAMARILEPFALGRAGGVTGVSEGTLRAVLDRYPRCAGMSATALPFGAEPADFEFVRAHPRANLCFHPGDGLLHVLYAGVCIPGMIPALRCLFEGLRSLRDRDPGLAARFRLHFVGTNYSPGDHRKRAEPVAAEFGVADLVEETTGRVAYLDALQLLLDAHGLLILGTDEPHYTASKVFPCALARKPVLAILHERSSAAGLLAALTPSRAVTFGDAGPGAEQAAEVTARLEALAADSPDSWPAPDLSGYTARDMTRKLAAVFDRAAESAR